MKQIEYDKHVTYICVIHCKCYMVSRTSLILYIKQDHMKQIEYDKHVTYICVIHCKCYMVLRTSVILYIKQDHMKQIEYDKHVACNKRCIIDLIVYAIGSHGYKYREPNMWKDLL